MNAARLPALFVSHGSPMLALDETNPAHTFLKSLGEGLPRPRAILVISAHWETATPRLTGAQHLDTLHDFYGFPEPLYALRYPAPGAHALAKDIARKLGPPAGVDRVRGLDHGAWVPLRLMYPQADIPVLQLSLQTALGPAHHLALGEALKSLRDEGVLILGSGGATHNLREYFHPAGGYESYAEFSDWLYDALIRDDRDALLDYRRRAPQGARNHPTEEHFLPLFVALGAGGASITRLHHSFDRSLCMDAYRLAD
ncbi:MAG TPA: class III extradiol ring-cleavage dioxygenase [Gammaproteobacteria bacterium]|nr:class III extradiol ring-cleavage dioxygenase [Gammaproteobacteria bacterium]